MKKYLIIFLIFLLTVPAMSKTLTGGVVYTVESAREAAFDGIEYEISMEPFKKYLKDPGFISPAEKDGGKPKISKRGRYVTFFSYGTYGVIYKNDVKTGFYYSNSGYLEYIEFTIGANNIYPVLKKRYDRNGNFDSVAFFTSRTETYIYDKYQKLDSHWVDDNCFDENGRVILKIKNFSK